MQLTSLDIGIVVAYLCFALAVGIYSMRRASGSTVAFFAAGRSLPGWLLGISMVATTFAVDTPLAVTGIVAKDGIAGNWFWWCTAVAHVGVIVLFGRLWRRSEVLTDAELVEIRYGGRAASVLRSVQACFFAVVVNSIVLGWGLVAASKLVEAVLPTWPAWWTIFAMVAFALLYASLGGLRAIVLTDLAQFTFAMGGALALAIYAVHEVGGLAALLEGVRTTPGVAPDTLDLLPRPSSGTAVITVFATYMLVQWWARLASDGGGYLAQRMVAAKDPEQARIAATWFVWLHYVVRPWPWILVALAALVIYPPGAGLLPDGDREAAYPLLLVKLLPSGLLGIALASLLAAFMSTVDTHLNWGTSYLVNDLYRRLLRPQAGRKELLVATWAGMLVMAALALAVASRFDTVEGAWRFLALTGAGLGLPTILRWLWWRMTAWGELAGMAVGATTGAALITLWPDMLYAHRLWIVVGASLVASGLAVALGPRCDEKVLQRFHDQVKPPGFWGRFGRADGFGLLLLAWLAGAVSVYSVLLGIGSLLLGSPGRGAALVRVGGACWLGCRALMKRADVVRGDGVVGGLSGTRL